MPHFFVKKVTDSPITVLKILSTECQHVYSCFSAFCTSYRSMNINSIRGKKLELLAFLDFHQPHVVAIQETKIDSSIATSVLFPETYPYSVYRKDRNIHGGGVMLLVHKDISHMPITELENDFDLLTYFIQDSADKHIPSKTTRSVSSITWITPEIRRKIRRKIKPTQRQKRKAAANLDQNLKL